MSRLATVLFVSAAAVACGCASVFQGTTQTIPVTSNPPGAQLQVFVEGERTADAETPTTVKVKKGNDVELQLQLRGYRPAHVELDRSLSGGFFADLMLVAPIPFIVDLADGAAWKYAKAIDVTLVPVRTPATDADAFAEPGVVEGAAGRARPSPRRDLRFTVALLIGTGYGWSSGNADVNADTKFSGTSWARLGHLVPEIGLLSLQDRMFVSAGARYQVIDGTTDVFATGRDFQARRSALAFFSKLGWLLRSPERTLQPYLSVAWGWGRIAHLARLPQLPCGPQGNEACVDTVSSGPWFLGAGAGLRWRLTDQLFAVLALEGQSGAPQRTTNVDGDVGLSMMF
jgi:hypothetical protein